MGMCCHLHQSSILKVEAGDNLKGLNFLLGRVVSDLWIEVKTRFAPPCLLPLRCIEWAIYSEPTNWEDNNDEDDDHRLLRIKPSVSSIPVLWYMMGKSSEPNSFPVSSAHWAHLTLCSSASSLPTTLPSAMDKHPSLTRSASPKKTWLEKFYSELLPTNDGEELRTKYLLSEQCSLSTLDSLIVCIFAAYYTAVCHGQASIVNKVCVTKEDLTGEVLL